MTEEVDGLKFRLTLIDEDAVQKLRNARIAEKTCADKAERELGNLRSAYQLTNWDGARIGSTYKEERNVQIVPLP